MPPNNTPPASTTPPVAADSLSAPGTPPSQPAPLASTLASSPTSPMKKRTGFLATLKNKLGGGGSGNSGNGANGSGASGVGGFSGNGFSGANGTGASGDTSPTSATSSVSVVAPGSAAIRPSSTSDYPTSSGSGIGIGSGSGSGSGSGGAIAVATAAAAGSGKALGGASAFERGSTTSMGMSARVGVSSTSSVSASGGAVVASSASMASSPGMGRRPSAYALSSPNSPVTMAELARRAAAAAAMAAAASPSMSDSSPTTSTAVIAPSTPPATTPPVIAGSADTLGQRTPSKLHQSMADMVGVGVAVADTMKRTGTSPFDALASQELLLRALHEPAEQRNNAASASEPAAPLPPPNVAITVTADTLEPMLMSHALRRLCSMAVYVPLLTGVADESAALLCPVIAQRVCAEVRKALLIVEQKLKRKSGNASGTASATTSATALPGTISSAADGAAIYHTPALRALVDRKLERHVREVLAEKQALIANARCIGGKSGSCSERGKRATNEDAFVIQPFLLATTGNVKSKNTISYYAVFDGHGGPACAAFVTRQLHVIMARHPDIDRGSHFMRRVITESFTECQELWRREVLRSAGALSEGSGCTGAVAIVYNRRLFIAWVGDTSVLLINDGICVNFVTPHKASLPSEERRIIAAGGFVRQGRLNGNLAVSRAFGDLRYDKIITCEPEIIDYTLGGSEDYLMLACDGVTDVMNSLELGDCLKALTASGMRKSNGGSLNSAPGNDMDAACAGLVRAALDRGSTDNVTAVLVPLKRRFAFVPRDNEVLRVEDVPLDERLQMMSPSAEVYEDITTTSSAKLLPIATMPATSTSSLDERPRTPKQVARTTKKAHLIIERVQHGGKKEPTSATSVRVTSPEKEAQVREIRQRHPDLPLSLSEDSLIKMAAELDEAMAREVAGNVTGDAPIKLFGYTAPVVQPIVQTTLAQVMQRHSLPAAPRQERSSLNNSPPEANEENEGDTATALPSELHISNASSGRRTSVSPPLKSPLTVSPLLTGHRRKSSFAEQRLSAAIAVLERASTFSLGSVGASSTVIAAPAAASLSVETANSNSGSPHETSSPMGSSLVSNSPSASSPMGSSSSLMRRASAGTVHPYFAFIHSAPLPEQMASTSSTSAVVAARKRVSADVSYSVSANRTPSSNQENMRVRVLSQKHGDLGASSPVSPTSPASGSASTSTVKPSTPMKISTDQLQRTSHSNGTDSIYPPVSPLSVQLDGSYNGFTRSLNRDRGEHHRWSLQRERERMPVLMSSGMINTLAASSVDVATTSKPPANPSTYSTASIATMKTGTTSGFSMASMATVVGQQSFSGTSTIPRTLNEPALLSSMASSARSPASLNASSSNPMAALVSLTRSINAARGAAAAIANGSNVSAASAVTSGAAR